MAKTSRYDRPIRTIELIPPQPGLPDLVFTANAGVILENRAIVSRFYHPERQGEEPYFHEVVRSIRLSMYIRYQYNCHLKVRAMPYSIASKLLLAGYGFRTELDAHNYLANWLDIEVLSLRLIDRRFYHLDTCFCPLSGGLLALLSACLDRHSQQLIERRVPPHKRIAVSEIDAIKFACNSINLDEIS